MDALLGLTAPTVKSQEKTQPTTPLTPTNAIHGTRPASDPCASIDESRKGEIETQISTIVNSVNAIKEANANLKGINTIFQSFENYISLASTLESLTQTEFQNELNKIVTDELKKPGTLISGSPVSIATYADVNPSTFEKYKEFTLKQIRDARTNMEDAYDKLYDLVLQNRNAANCLRNEFKNSKEDRSLHILLTQLPETKTKYFTLRDWATTSYDTVKDKIWPSIDNAVKSLRKYYTVSFTIPSLTVMADKDLQTMSLSIKTITDNKEVRKVDKITVYTIGGFRIDYGVGLYYSTLGDDEYTTFKTEKIEKEAYIKDPQTIDSIYKNVTYTTIKKSSDITANWGAMAYIQGRSNWDSWVNVGSYFGLGLLSNNESRPVFSLGGSVIFGRLQRASLNFGVAFSKIEQLNPHYSEDTEIRGDISDPTELKMSNGFLLGMFWKIGSIK